MLVGSLQVNDAHFQCIGHELILSETTKAAAQAEPPRETEPGAAALCYTISEGAVLHYDTLVGLLG